MINYIKVFFSTLDKKHFNSLIIIFFMIFLSVFFETLGIGLIIPLVSLLINEEFLDKFPFLIIFVEFLGNPSKEKLLAYFVVFFIVVYFVKNIFLGLLTWKKSKFIFSIANFYAQKLLHKYLKKPYFFYLENNSSKLINNLINETSLASGQFILSVIDLTIEFLLIGSIFILLIYVQPNVTIIVTVLFIVFGLFYYFSVKKRILKFGYLRQETNNLRLKLYNEIFSNIKFHLIYKKTKKILDDIFKNLDQIKNLNVRYIFLQHLPKFLFEFLVVLIFSLIILIHISSDLLLIENLLSTLALFAAASFRILPSVNKIIQRLQNLKFSKSAIIAISNELNQNIEAIEINENKNNEKLKFETLEINNASFKYKNNDEYIFKNLSLKINKSKIYGFIGTTGSGKSTLIDLIMSLQDLDEGKIILNNSIDLKKIRSQWHKLIGYVPQSIFLHDDSIKNNIAVGEYEDEINLHRLNKAIKYAQLEKYILNLKDGVDTIVGENGSKLSGGQIQRIGIARALYINPEILIFDEITSSIDSDTEKELLEVIKNLKQEKTIILITHKSSNLEICDEIYKVKNKEIINLVK
tara:strand:- start:17 stop:1756 length:1740 start_codon:yes stop_codon:yes gene_type:complete